MESGGVCVEQFLTFWKLFKQLVLGGAYQLAVVGVSLRSGCWFLTRANLAVIELFDNVGHLLILQNNMLNV